MPAALCLLLVLGFLPRDNLQLELHYAAKLRDQGMLRLAQLQCQQLLKNDELDQDDRGRITIELAKTLSARALNSRPPRRERYWRAAADALAEELATSSQPTKILLQTQQGLTTLLQGEWARREAEVRATTEQDWQSARALLRAAIGQFKRVEADLLGPELRRGSDQLNDVQLQELLRNVRLQLAKAYWNQALTYSSSPTDRVNSLTQALDTLEPLATNRISDSLVWEARVERIRCLRLLKEYEQVGKLLSEGVDAPEAFLPLMAAEGIRLALAVNNPDAALQLAKSSSTQRHPEFELAMIETLVILAMNAEENDSQEKRQQLQRQAAQRASTLADEFGTYWGLLAEMLIARLAEQPATVNDMSLLETAAKSFLQRNLPEDAIQMFASAADKAEQAGNLASALGYQTKAAAIDHQQGNLQDALDRLRAAALKYDAQAAAAEAHLSAVFNAAALYQQQARASSPRAPASLAQYESLLLEHLATWSGHRSANQARLWLARLYAATNKVDAAIRALQDISPTAAESKQRFKLLTNLLLRLPSGSDEAILAARHWFDQQAQLVAADSAEATAALVAAAELRLLRQPTDYLGADASLRRALAAMPVNSAELPTIHTLLVVAAAGRQQMSVARSELAKALPLPAPDLSRLLRGLQVVHDERPGDTELLAIMGQVAKLLTTYRDQLSATELLLLTETEADTLRFSDYDRATEIYAQLATDNPASARIQEQYAELLALGDRRAARLAALEQWRLVARKSKPRSPAWFRAKLGVATSHSSLGQRDQAREIIDLLLSLHPELGGPALKSKFLQLRESLDE